MAVQIFDDVAEILAQMNPGQIIMLKAPKSMADQVSRLIKKKKEGDIGSDEIIELERYLALDMLINLAKARAKLILAA